MDVKKIVENGATVAGGRAVLSVSEFMASKKGLALRNVNANVMEVLEMTGLDSLLEVR